MTNTQQTVFLYVPCQMDLYQGATVMSTIQVLERLGQFCHYDPESTCCGRRFYVEGELHYAKDLSYQVVKSYTNYCNLHKKLFPIVIPDSACAGYLKRDSNTILKNATLPQELTDFVNNVYELCDYIVNVLKQTSLHNTFNSRVFYFKTCSSNCKYPYNNAPEILLSNTEGLDLIIDDQKTCCGANGRFPMMNPEVANKMAGEIVKRAYESGANYITATDIHCLQMLDAYKQSHNVDVEIIPIADILAANGQNS